MQPFLEGNLQYGATNKISLSQAVTADVLKDTVSRDILIYFFVLTTKSVLFVKPDSFQIF